MNGDWRVFLFLLVIISSFHFSLVSAVSLSVDNVNDTLAIVSISGADSIYSYEANLDYTGTIVSVTQANFLGSTDIAIYGFSTRDNILSGYGSSTNDSADYAGVSGSGPLFNVTHTGGTLSLRFLLVVETESAGGDEEYVYYNNSDSGSGDSGSGGGGGSGSGGTTTNDTTTSDDGTDDEGNSGDAGVGGLEELTEVLGDILPPTLSPYALYILIVGFFVFFLVICYIIYSLIKRAHRKAALASLARTK